MQPLIPPRAQLLMRYAPCSGMQLATQTVFTPGVLHVRAHQAHRMIPHSLTVCMRQLEVINNGPSMHTKEWCMLLTTP
jgi:hypothetical protein